MHCLLQDMANILFSVASMWDWAMTLQFCGAHCHGDEILFCVIAVGVGESKANHSVIIFTCARRGRSRRTLLFMLFLHVHLFLTTS
jgi:hypothetical protein